MVRRFAVTCTCWLSIMLLWSSPASSDVFEDVPAARDYELVYSVDISETGDFARSGVPYQNDARAAWDNNFDRVAYYLKLQRPNAPAQFVFVSGEAFTSSGLELGIPRGGARFSIKLLSTT